ncbi:MAG: FHA domain-containing protein [Gammaproteobacteria bacterium]|nr:FHA domain-containing protein [Gammaproteobacteria bacterium]
MDHALTYAFVEGNKIISADNILNSVCELNWVPFGEQVDEVQSTSDTTYDQIVVNKKIVVKKNDIWKGEYPINKSRLNIGRHGDNDIVLSEPRISRVHAQIMINGDDIIIQDLNSKNGTYTGSKRIDVHSLEKGDVITIASYELIFTDLDDDMRDDVTDSVNVLQYPFSAHQKK